MKWIKKTKLKYMINMREYPNISKFEKNFFTPKANIYLGKTYTPKIKFKSPMICELEHLFDCVTNKKKPITSGEYALKVMRVLEMVDKKVS